MKNFVACLIMAWIATSSLAAVPWKFRPPAVPLVTHDPYFSIWSMSDRLTDDWPMHWSGAAHAICGLVRIDGKTYRFLGPQPSGVSDVPAMEQTDLQVTPTRTIAKFKAAGVELTVSFCSPLLPSDLRVLARPVTYLDLQVSSIDGKNHQVAAYIDACGEIAVHSTDQTVAAMEVESTHPMLAIGTVAPQPLRKRSGDAVRIDWGHLYLAADAIGAKPIAGPADQLRSAFVQNKIVDKKLDLAPRAVNKDWPVIGFAVDAQTVEPNLPASAHFALAYDEDKAIEYLRTPLDPYWKKEGSIATVIENAIEQRGAIEDKCRDFDQRLIEDLTQVGGEKYAQICALAYRQALAGHGLFMSPDGRPLMFPKENSSNGCIGTVDILYPAAPLFALLSPALMEANLAPVIEYADSPRWKHPFAPHDLGTYPLANGQVYGGGEKTDENQMPIEESGNMLLVIAAMEKATDLPSRLVEKHGALLKKWADYLVDKGLDPENQLCTDDFTGHLAHNVNLSAKAIVAIAAYGQICENHERRAEGNAYIDKAKAMAARWAKMADDVNASGSGHTRLAFDKPGTWSQKYNLAWDDVLGLHLFPRDLKQREVAFYKTKLNTFGVPLDNRAAFTKVDWTIWSACLSSNRGDFDALIDPLYKFVNETPDRVPLTDWYQTDNGRNMSFRARPVIGGVFMKMLTDQKRWSAWAWAKSN